ncbi:hypothetical protein YC2023_038313 [Brassica napus]
MLTDWSQSLGSKKLVKDRITVYSGGDKSTRSLGEGFFSVATLSYSLSSTSLLLFSLISLEGILDLEISRKKHHGSQSGREAGSGVRENLSRTMNVQPKSYL